MYLLIVQYDRYIKIVELLTLFSLQFHLDENNPTETKSVAYVFFQNIIYALWRE